MNDIKNERIWHKQRKELPPGNGIPSGWKERED